MRCRMRDRVSGVGFQVSDLKLRMPGVLDFELFQCFLFFPVLCDGLSDY